MSPTLPRSFPCQTLSNKGFLFIMALKKDDAIGTVTGSPLKQSTRGKKGGLTGSTRVTGSKKSKDVPVEIISENLTESTAEPTPSSVVEKLQQIGNTATSVIERGANAVSAVQGLTSRVAETIKSTDADRNPATITDGSLDSTAIMSRASAEIDEAIPRMESAEAINKGIVIAQQRNFVGVAIANTKLKQDIATLDIEQKRLLGLLIDGKTEQVHNEKKAVTFHRAVVGRDTEISKLEQDRELLTQQRIRTDGTQQQTKHIQESELLKIEKLREANDKQRLEIQNMQHEKEKLKQEVTAKFLAGY